jgi:hypothetical protein
MGKRSPAGVATFNFDIVGECWIQTGIASGRYGETKVDGIPERSSRLIYKKTHPSRLLSDDVHILHSCDTPNCMNPGHLRPGSHQDNVDDKVRKNRQYRPPSELNPFAKLNWNKVREMRFRRKNGERVKDLATCYGISRGAASGILNGHYWKEEG